MQHQEFLESTVPGKPFTMKPKVLIVDDHALVAEGLRRLLENDFELTGAVTDAESMISAAEEKRPDLIVLDISMPGMNGIQAARELTRRGIRSKIVFVTQQTGRYYIEAAMNAGASGYVLKQAAPHELVRALHDVMHGRTYITPSINEPANTGINDLTSRQRQVLQLVAEGKSAKEIASALNISPKTVEFHKAAIVERLGVRTTAELTRYAIESGLIPN